MKIRWKILILVLALSLIPLMVVATLDRRAMIQLGGSLADLAVSFRISMAKEDL